jgi:hypothetical protein
MRPINSLDMGVSSQHQRCFVIDESTRRRKTAALRNGATRDVATQANVRRIYSPPNARNISWGQFPYKGEGTEIVTQRLPR